MFSYRWCATVLLLSALTAIVLLLISTRWSAESQTRRRLREVTLAIEDYHAEYGRLPDSVFISSSVFS